MRVISISYGQALFELALSQKEIEDGRKILRENPELKDALRNPTISFQEKERVIDRIFSESVGSFLKVICRNDDAECLEEAFEYYDEQMRKKNKVLAGTLTYVTKPQEAQISRIRKYLKKEYQAEDVILELKEDASLIGGFILKVGDRVMDRSLKGKLEMMTQNLAWR